MKIEKISLEGFTIDVSKLEDKELLNHLLDKFEEFKWFAKMYGRDFELKMVKK